ncbi:hypothetical protein [Saprospira grandis]|uniref:Transmembrane protein n=1 Tax=Saprospira grandis (strain Lewin) TaxID=984262 RepID=H6L909_SAPGL|nr:hypothetical protein [Saprospira grandis]AFC23145.1 hypothetical protein SGRA_0406 [Saprospira grandis str. Lewin]
MPDLFLSKAKVLFPNFFLLDLDQEIYRAAFFCFFYAILFGALLLSVVELRTEVLVVAARYFFGASAAASPCGATFRSSLFARPCAKKQVFCWGCGFAALLHIARPLICIFSLNFFLRPLNPPFQIAAFN